MTDAERKLWRILREAFDDHHFRRQVPIRHFIVDFASHSAKLVVEVDGGQHDGAIDGSRTALLEDEGYRVIRFWNNEVLGNPDGVWMSIDAALRERAASSPLCLMGTGRGGVISEVERDATVTPSQPSPIEGEG